jgi:predicted nucleic acid-binding protein
MPGADLLQPATVLDASVAVRWLVAEPGSAEAAALLARPTRWIAPRLILTEVAGALHRKSVAGVLHGAVAMEALQVLLDAVDGGALRLAQDENVMAAALVLAARLGHPVPDCVYLALAENEDAGLATADPRLASLAERRGIAATLVP